VVELGPIVVEAVEAVQYVNLTNQKRGMDQWLVEQIKKRVARLAPNIAIALYAFQGAKNFNFFI
jgi:predicted deacetylase